MINLTLFLRTVRRDVKEETNGKGHNTQCVRQDGRTIGTGAKPALCSELDKNQPRNIRTSRKSGSGFAVLSTLRADSPDFSRFFCWQFRDIASRLMRTVCWQFDSQWEMGTEINLTRRDLDHMFHLPDVHKQ